MSMYQSRDVEVKVDGIWLEEKRQGKERGKGKGILGFFRNFLTQGCGYRAVIILYLYSWLFWHPGCPHNMTVRISPPYCRPSLDHVFGTDEFGRDIFGRIVHGSRISLEVAL